MRASQIKVISEEDLGELETRSLSAHRRDERSRRSGEVHDLMTLLRTRARPIAEVAGKVNETEVPLLVLIDEGAGTTALDLFASILRSVGEDRDRMRRLVDALMPVEEIPSDSAVEQARRNAVARADFLQEFPSVTSSEVADLYGSSARNRAALAQGWLKQGRVFCVPVAAGHRFPLFQFGVAGNPKPAMADVLAPLKAAGLDGWELALWFAGRLASLGGQRPVDLLDDDPARVVEAARSIALVPQ